MKLQFSLATWLLGGKRQKTRLGGRSSAVLNSRMGHRNEADGADTMLRHGSIRRQSVIVLLFAIALVGYRSILADDTNVVDRIKIVKNADSILVPVNVNGKDYLFLLDTGSAFTLFDNTLLNSKPIDDITFLESSPNDPRWVYNVPLATIGHSSLGDTLSLAPEASGAWRIHSLCEDKPAVAGADFSRMREVSGKEIYGVIGMDFLCHWAMQISFDRSELLLLRKPTKADHDEMFELYYDDDGCPLVRCQASDRFDFDFVLDTGCQGDGCLASQIADYLLPLGGIEKLGKAGYVGIDGDHTSQWLRLNSLGLGHHRIPRPIFLRGAANCIGLGFLSRFEVTFDFPNKLLYVREGNEINKPEARTTNYSGMHLVRKNKRTIVESITAHSAAVKSGMNVGDIILKVNQLDASTTPLREISQEFGKGYSVIRVIAERNGRQFGTKIFLSLSRNLGDDLNRFDNRKVNRHHRRIIHRRG
jgi:hypothetical protein